MVGNNLIKLTYAEASHPNFSDAFRRLLNQPMNLKVAYGIKRIADEVNRLKLKMAKEYEAELIHKFVKKDDKGVPIVNLEQEGYQVDEKDKEEFKKAEKEFGKKEVVLSRDKLSLGFLSNFSITLTPAELHALSPIVMDDLEEESEEKSSA